MKTQLVTLVGDPKENLYQLGLKEKESFLKLEDRVTRLLSTNQFLRHGQDIITRARSMFNKKNRPETFFEECIESYAEGLGIESTRYLSFLTLFEFAAHYGQVYPELKGLLPGCTSLFQKKGEEITHTRLLDFPLLGVFDENPRLYYWKCEGKPTILSYSCEGLAPLFFQVIHSSGFSLSLHHKPGQVFHKTGTGIFQLAFEALFEMNELSDLKKILKSQSSMTKWSFLLCDKVGAVVAIDIDGPALNIEAYNLKETSPLIFTNIPLQEDGDGFESFLKFCHDRQSWLKEKLSRDSNKHMLDVITDVEDQKVKKWFHPAATLSTIAGYEVNLTQGHVDVKEGNSALVASDAIMRFSLLSADAGIELKPAGVQKPFEQAWKRASQAQCSFDQGEYDLAYHHLQMSQALMPSALWKDIFGFYLCVWDFIFINNSRELAHTYKRLKPLKLPENLNDQKTLLIMRLEKKLGLSSSVFEADVSLWLRDLFNQEKEAPKALFSTWMKLLYPRIELLDVYSPYRQKDKK